MLKCRCGVAQSDSACSREFYNAVITRHLQRRSGVLDIEQASSDGQYGNIPGLSQ